MQINVRRALTASALATALGLTSLSGVAAQQPSQIDLSASIRAGTCENLSADTTYQLGDFIEISDDDVIGSTDFVYTHWTEATIAIDIDELLQPGSPYSFVVSDNTDPNAGPVACGEIGGVVVQSRMVIGVEAEGSEDLVGSAVFGTRNVDQQAIPTPAEGESQTSEQLDTEVIVSAYISEDAVLGVDDEDEVTPDSPVATATPGGSTPAPTVAPTTAPTAEPTAAPTAMPTDEPTVVPTTEPTVAPTSEPTVVPTVVPTIEPTTVPTIAPTVEPTTET